MSTTVATDDFKEWFNDILAVSVAMCRDRLANGKSIMPHLLIFERKQEEGTVPRMAYVPVEMSTVLEKNITAQLQAALASNPQLVAGVVLVTETWVLKVEKHNAAELEAMRKSKEGIENNPNREEGMMWSALRGNMQLMAFAHVTRPEIGTPTLGEPEILDNALGHFEGRFVPGGERTKQ